MANLRHNQHINLHSEKRGFTLVEICVAAAILSVMLYSIYSMFSGGIRSFRQAEGKTESLEYGILAYEMIAQDCRRAVFHGLPADSGEPGDPGLNPCKLGPDGKSITFIIFHSMDFFSTKLPRALRQVVTYSIAPSGYEGYGYLRRNEKIHKNIKISSMELKVIEGSRSDSTLQKYLSMKIRGYGNRAQDEQLLIGLIAFDSYNLRQIHPHFVENDDLLQGKF